MKTCSERTLKYRQAKRQAVVNGFKGLNSMPRKTSKITDPEVKAKWLAALRSGKYEQGTGKLKTVNPTTGQAYFCCLGVLCDVLNPDGWYVSSHTFRGKSSQTMYPNQNVMKELGIYPSAMRKLGIMNDEKSEDFNKIADYIEKNL